MCSGRGGGRGGDSKIARQYDELSLQENAHAFFALPILYMQDCTIENAPDIVVLNLAWCIYVYS